MKLRTACGIVAMLFGAINFAGAEVRLPALFSDHCVLQRDLADAIWGWATPGEKVTVTIAGESATATTDEDGNWRVRLKPLKAGGPYELVIAGKSTVTIPDVLVGDVWICAGQAGMGIGLGAVDHGPDAVAAATNSLIRILTDSSPASAVPLADVPSGWAVGSPQTVSNFSAVGYFFGKRIQTETRVPLGLINLAWDGAALEPWLKADSLRSIPELAGMLKESESLHATYAADLAKYLVINSHWLERARAAQANGKPIPPPPTPPTPTLNSRSLSSIYNARIAPFTPYGIKGALWYQGENNSDEGDSYYDKLRALISGWRTAWNQGEFPFYYTQVENYGAPVTENPAGGDGCANLRMVQLKALQIPHTGMAVTLDIGAVTNGHLPNKEDIGNRLALWALKYDYGRNNIVCSGPLYKGMKIEEDKIRLSFDSVGGGLMVGKRAGPGRIQEDIGGTLQKFAIAGEDKKWVWADAEIKGATVVVSSPGVSDPVAVRYAYSANPEGCNLYNNEGLPAAPFRTDDW